MGFSSACRCFATVFVLPAILACEAPLVLDRVEAQRALPTQRSDLLQAVATNRETLVVVGNRGAVITSQDNGTSWRRQVLEGTPFLLDVTVCPDGQFVALAAERQVWIGEENGANWRVAPMGTDEAPQALTCDPRGRIWVVGSFSTILRSDDLGQTWMETSLDEDLHFTTIQFVDENNAFMTGEFGVVVRTTDAGETWENLEALPDEFYPQAAYFRDTQTGWVVGLTGTVFNTTDGGTTWSRQDTGTDAPLYGIGHGGSALYVVGGYGTVLKLGASGSWSRIDHGKPIRFYLRGVTVLSNRRLLTAGGDGALFVLPT